MRTLLLFATALLMLSPTVAQDQTESVEAQLCRAQLELLMARQKLTPEEEAVFVKQCDCLAAQENSSSTDPKICAQDSL